MKKIGIVLALVLFFCAGSVMAQEKIQEGFRIGATMSDFHGSQMTKASSQTGFTVAGFVSYQMNSFFALQPEAQLSVIGAKGNFTIFNQDSYQKMDLGYLNIPILAKFLLSTSTVKPSIIVGPSINVNFSHHFTPKAGANNYFPQPVPTTVGAGLVYGVGLEVNHFVVDVRYNMGLTNTFNLSNARNGVAALSVGYAF